MPVHRATDRRKASRLFSEVLTNCHRYDQHLLVLQCSDQSRKWIFIRVICRPSAAASTWARSKVRQRPERGPPASAVLERFQSFSRRRPTNGGFPISGRSNKSEQTMSRELLRSRATASSRPISLVR